MGRKRITQKSLLENLIWDTWFETRKGKKIYTTGQGQVLAAVGLVLEYLEQEDKENNSDLVKEFVLSYLKEDAITAKKLCASEIYRRAGIEIIRNGKGRFFRIVKFAVASIESVLLKSRKARYRCEAAAELFIPAKKLQRDTNRFMIMFEDYYDKLIYLE